MKLKRVSSKCICESFSFDFIQMPGEIRKRENKHSRYIQRCFICPDWFHFNGKISLEWNQWMFAWGCTHGEHKRFIGRIFSCLAPCSLEIASGELQSVTLYAKWVCCPASKLIENILMHSWKAPSHLDSGTRTIIATHSRAITTECMFQWEYKPNVEET